jgi:hypothetical protein
MYPAFTPEQLAFHVGALLPGDVMLITKHDLDRMAAAYGPEAKARMLQLIADAGGHYAIDDASPCLKGGIHFERLA